MRSDGYTPVVAKWSPGWGSLRTKTILFVVIAVAVAYVLYHNERFLFEPANPVWLHYKDLGVFLLIHGVAGASALILAPMQFSERLRMQFTKLHRVVGRIYVTAALVLAPFGVYAQWLDERLGLFPRSFTIETVIQASILMITTAFGLAFARKRMIPQHRQWMTRSYAAALTFIWIRVVLGLTGWDQNVEQNAAMIETVVWCFTATAVLVGDIANQIYELQSTRSRLTSARMLPEPIAAE
jgi:uncharacterized membrane protein